MSERLNPNEVFEEMTKTDTEMTPKEREKFVEGAVEERKRLNEQQLGDAEDLK